MPDYDYYAVSPPRYVGGPFWVSRFYEKYGLHFVAEVSRHWTLGGAARKARRLNRRAERTARHA